MKGQPRIGLIGTITSDTIDYDDGRSFRSLGGALYQAAFLCGAGAETVLFSRCGEDLRPEVESAAGAWPSLDWRGLSFLPGPGNRVRLRYAAGAPEREEVLESCVPPLSPDGILPRLSGLDALMLVFNSGFDIGLADWRRVVGESPPPVWVDIHSLALDPVVGARRRYRPLPEWRDWVRGAAWLQANRQEAACMLGHPERRPEEAELDRFSEEAFGLGLKAVFLTMGQDGVWAATPAGTRFLRSPSPSSVVDTTGCGDVFAAATALGLVSGLDVFEAARRGVILASAAAGSAGWEAVFRLARERAAAAGGIDSKESFS